MPVHVYGNPCQVEEIQNIADTYGFRVVYDACHAFGVKLNEESILKFGDLSVLSFHATKIFTTFEGGAIICHDEKTKKRIDFLKNFGFADEVTVVAPGINAKMNEFQASVGILQLQYIEQCIEKCKSLTHLYRRLLDGLPGIRVLRDSCNVRHNYSYFPILINEKELAISRDDLYGILKEHNIFGRRYFFPLISQFPTYKGLPSASPENIPIAQRISKQILCLPIYPELQPEVVTNICSIIEETVRSL